MSSVVIRVVRHVNEHVLVSINTLRHRMPADINEISLASRKGKLVSGLVMAPNKLK